MFKSLKSLAERFRYVAVIKRRLTSPSNQKNNFERIVAVQSAEHFNEQLINNESPVIISFSAEWCQNCKILTPMIESIVLENPRKMKLLKVDVDKHMDLALEYNLSVIPVLFGIKDGEIQSTLTGLHNLDKIQNWIDDFLKQS